MTQRMDHVFARLREEARATMNREPLLRAFITARITAHDDLAGCLTAILSRRLADDDLPREALESLFAQCHAQDETLADMAASDILSVLERDAAAEDALSVVLYQKGFQALQSHRLAHHLHGLGRTEMAMMLQSRSAEVFGVDIHPRCPIGESVMFDHATGIVIGETASIGDNVSILQGVTLGGTGKVGGQRHPQVRSGVLIGAGAIVLGNIEIGWGAQIGAGSVVLDAVEPHTTVVGVPARPVGRPCCPSPSVTMEHGAFDREQYGRKPLSAPAHRTGD
ncbi:serine O-acetyltransferase EpsC [Kushneria phosphatilytica]|uniref:Serine acetyltransferase n=1 Tax=Kushneria phosphatilytica TaxID=657387 RepID=A0A1S1NYI2_9GAMM|nr:serine O-acetyltransferase EpsC [Kushneria phosphatilytica]OHV12925.1 serine O-acetyltransferase [Kushneria phosphatilytica]QEL10791.1 serine O-acetyltransferase [Kushneria phosphatilytica]